MAHLKYATLLLILVTLGSAVRAEDDTRTTMLKAPSQQPEDIANGTNYTVPATVNSTGYIPHADTEQYAYKEDKFEETKIRIRREIANGLRAAFPRIRQLVTAFRDEEGFVRNGIVFCGAPHDQSSLLDKYLRAGDTKPGVEDQFPRPAGFSTKTGSLSLVDGWSDQSEYITDGTTASGCGFIAQVAACDCDINSAANACEVTSATGSCTAAETTACTGVSGAKVAGDCDPKDRAVINAHCVPDEDDHTVCSDLDGSTTAKTPDVTKCHAKNRTADYQPRNSTQCDRSNCTEGSFVNIVSRFIRAHGYHVQHNDICQAMAKEDPAIGARTCNLRKYPVNRKAYRCDRNASNMALDWWQVNKQCYGLSEGDCLSKCKWDSVERFCRASEAHMGSETGCKEDEDESITASTFVNEVWRVLGYSVQSEVKAVPTTDKAVVTGSEGDGEGETGCKTPRAFVNAMNGNAQINAFRDLGIEEAVAQWHEELKGVRSYLTSLSALLTNFYPTTLTMFPFIENEELDECPMGDVVRNPNTESGTEEQPLCEQVDFQTYDKLNRINEAGQSMLRATCFCRNGELDTRKDGVEWGTGKTYDEDDANFAPCVLQTSVKCKLQADNVGCEVVGAGTNTACANDLTSATAALCEAHNSENKCVIGSSASNAACIALDGSTDDKTPADVTVCEALSGGTVVEDYTVHEFDQIYLEPNPDLWVLPDSGEYGVSGTTTLSGVTSDKRDCNKFKELLPSVYTYCTNIKVWGDTAPWQRTLDLLKPNKDRIKVRKGTNSKNISKAIIRSLARTLPQVENTCGRVVTAFNETDKQLMSNKGGNCVPFEKLHEIMYRVEFETSEADIGKVANETTVWDEQEEDNTTAIIYRDMFCGTTYSHSNSKFTFRQMSYLWDHIQGGSYIASERGQVSSDSTTEEFRPDGSHSPPYDYFKYESTTGAFPENQRYALVNRSFCYIDWIGDFSGASTRQDSFGDIYVDPYLLYSREIEEAIWNTAIAISSKKQVIIDNLELWDVLEQQLTNPEDGNILSSLSHAATKHFMKVRSTDAGEDNDDYTEFFNQE
jgi:hypothetical protein